MKIKMTKRHGLELVVQLVFFALIIAIIVIFMIVNAVISSQTLSYTEENSKTDTSLYVILNNNEFTPKTTLAFKDILAIAIMQGITTLDATVSVEYNGENENINLKNVLVNSLDKLGAKEYHFHVTWNSGDIMSQTTPGYDSNAAEQIEYISVPSETASKRVAKVILKISKMKQGTSAEYCPENFEYKCYPRLTCKVYNGNCMDDSYACGPLECCCKSPEI